MILPVRIRQLYLVIAATPKIGIFLVRRVSVTEGSG
jgi:hypothetical protein